jgi:integrase
MSLKEELKSKKPNLSDLSLTAYASTLRNLYKKVFDDQPIRLKNFDDTDKILDYLKNIEPSKRKSILSALVSMTGNDEYREMMRKDINTYNEFVKTQKKSDKQAENWVHKDEINKVYNEVLEKSKLLYRKNKHSMKELQDIQNHVILALTTGKYIPPRRLLDYTEFKINGDINKKVDNYYDKGTLVFNRFKGSTEKDQQRINAPKGLQSILSKWIKLNPTDHLLFDNQSGKLTNTQLTQRLNKIFRDTDAKNVSVNSLRHTYLTDKYANTIEQNKEIKKTMKEMGSSIDQLKNYVKDDE